MWYIYPYTPVATPLVSAKKTEKNAFLCLDIVDKLEDFWRGDHQGVAYTKYTGIELCGYQ